MTLSELVELVTRDATPEEYTYEVVMEVTQNGHRAVQHIEDVLVGEGRLVLISKEAIEADPLNQLPTITAFEGSKH